MQSGPSLAHQRVRARRLMEAEIAFIPDPTFDEYRGDSLDASGPWDSPRRPVPREVPTGLTALYEVPILTPERERELFRAMNYRRFRAARLRDCLDPERPDPARLDEIERLRAEAAAIRDEIVRANLRLVVALARRHVVAPPDDVDVVSEGNIALIHAVEKFDQARGFKFSTYAAGAILRSFHRRLPEAQKRRRRFLTGHDQAFETAIDPRPDERQQDLARDHAGATLARLLGRLSDRERRVLERRFGLNGREAMMLVELGAAMGVTRERVRQIETLAIKKLRRVANAEGIDSPLE